MVSDRVHRLREHLDALLDETVARAIERERSAFDEVAGSFRDSVVLFGARKLGRKTLMGLRSAGLEPLAFSDNDPETWGTTIDGLPVYAPSDAANRFGSAAVFVITIWGHGSTDSMLQRRERLEGLGCQKVISFVPLFWKYAGIFLPHNALDLPHHVIESSADIRRCFEILADESSKAGFVEQIAWRLTGEFDILCDPVDDEIYFPRFVDRLETPETFVDCGAYDGDTVMRFLSLNQNKFEKIFAFEPDPENFRELEENVAGMAKQVRDRIRISPFAVGEESLQVAFAATGTVGAYVGPGTYTVRCIALDEFLEGENPTYLKMDIEAAEPDALRGARNLIKKNQPVIAACSYHVQDHVWRITSSDVRIKL